MTASRDPRPPAAETGNTAKSRPGFARILRATRISVAGLRAAWNTEAAFRQEVALAAVLVPVAALLPASLTQKALLLACVLLVLVTELLNSALEATVDRISHEHHPLAGKAKDTGSAAVFLAIANLVVVWGLVLLEIVLAPG